MIPFASFYFFTKRKQMKTNIAETDCKNMNLIEIPRGWNQIEIIHGD
jgi:hypothetical protein